VSDTQPKTPVTPAIAPPADTIPAERPPDVFLSAILPDPEGYDIGSETVTLRNRSQTVVSLFGWALQVESQPARLPLEGDVEPESSRTVPIPPRSIQLRNRGDTVLLIRPGGEVHQRVSYSESDVVSGAPITLPDPALPTDAPDASHPPSP
jgi:hypothetical protein